MDKIAAYELILEDHPLWTKEAQKDDSKRRKGSRAKAARNSLIGSSVSQLVGMPTFAGTIGSAAGAQEGRRARTAAGHLAGAAGGSLLTQATARAVGLRRHGRAAAAAGHIGGGTLGTYLAHGKDS